ncbi:MAG: bifunctional oligoribonuclease/PAP phosphatase NrnA [Candidatus Omnitrophota bacterium]
MSLKKVIQEIRKRDNFLISSHVSPEGDAIGSELAFKNLLERLGKHSFIVNDHDVPREYKFLPGVNSICKPNQVHYFEVVVTLDCSDLERIGKVRRLIKPGTFIINIDHHISNSGFGDINWVEPKSSCVCEMIYKLFQGLKIRPDKAAAVAMYTGILTDTGSFHYSNTTSFTHQVVSKLLQKNIPVSRIYREIYESYSLAQIKFLGKMISQFNSHNHDKIVWLSLKRNIKDFGEGALELADSILNFARAVKNAEVVLLFKEIGINEVRVNLRSRGNIDVNRLAKTFGGGGHKTASGFTTKGQISTVERQVLKEVKKAFLRS